MHGLQAVVHPPRVSKPHTVHSPGYNDAANSLRMKNHSDLVSPLTAFPP